MRVLVVEDEGLVALEMQEALTNARVEVVGTAASIDSALQILNAVSVDAVILDGNLAGVNTLPLAEALRARRIPFLVVSGYEGSKLSGVMADAPFLAKPYTLAALAKGVQELRTELVRTGRAGRSRRGSREQLKLPRHARARRGHPCLAYLCTPCFFMNVSKAWMAGTSPDMTTLWVITQ